MGRHKYLTPESTPLSRLRHSTRPGNLQPSESVPPTIPSGVITSTTMNAPSDPVTPPDTHGSASDSTGTTGTMSTKRSLEELQTDEQRRVLDTVSQVRKCGLESVLSLPQIVVCGDQSAGKSSVLEALTEIPFPRDDNLCTRFATEISLRREPVSSLTIRVIPDSARPQNEQERIKNFSAAITDFEQLPIIMRDAKEAMGITNSGKGSAFAKDTLSIEIQGPDRPQLTLVDIPGLIQASTKGVSESDIALVGNITNQYIEQPRTICLAVVSATNDAANQPILQRVRRFDPQGERTLGVITKPDTLSPGSGAEAKFLELARNEDVFFKLGWHVIKNRKFEEKEFSIAERNDSENAFFTISNFKVLEKDNIGIDALRVKLSQILFDHVKKELPRLHEDLEAALKAASEDLSLLGKPRSTWLECREFLARLNMECYEICKAGINGYYNHEHFKATAKEPFSLGFMSTIASTARARRIRAVVQLVNSRFAEDLRKRGHKYHIDFSASEDSSETQKPSSKKEPQVVSKPKALKWVKRMLLRSRGTELIGNFNPHLIAELFWEQSEAWEGLAEGHVDDVSKLCENFVRNVLEATAPKDLKGRIWSLMIQDTLKERRKEALNELDELIKDLKEYPINYNHYYTSIIHKKRQERMQTQLAHGGSPGNLTRFLPDGSFMSCNDKASADMEQFSCEEALDCMLAIYKVQQKTFIANVATQVIERHIVRGLHDIFSPMVLINMSDAKVKSTVAEPAATTRQRVFLTDRIRKLEDGQEIFRDVLST